MAYLNKALKEMVITLTGLKVYVELILKDHPKYTTPYAKKLKTIHTYLDNMVCDFLKPLDPSQVKYLANQCTHSRVTLLPDTDDRTKKLYTVVETSVLAELVNTAFSECFLCEKCGKEARECKLKKNLLEVGAVARDNPKGECPFRRG